MVPFDQKLSICGANIKRAKCEAFSDFGAKVCDRSVCHRAAIIVQTFSDIPKENYLLKI